MFKLRQSFSVYLLIGVLAFSFLVFGNEKAIGQNIDTETKLVPYRKGKKWGISDTAGNFVVRPKYKEIRILRTGNFVLRRSNKEALADKNGKLLTAFKYSNISDFGPSQGFVHTPEVLAEIKVNKKKGFLDTLGNEALPPKYRLTNSLGDGLFTAGNWRKSRLPGRREVSKIGLFKTGGQKLLPKRYDGIDRLNGGYLLLSDFKGRGYGLANPKGKIILPTNYLNISALSEGFFSAMVFPEFSPFGIRGEAFFDTTGRMVFNQQFNAINKTNSPENITFRNGRAAVRDINQKWGYINRKGELVIPYIYEMALVFNNGYAIVSKDLKTSGLIDTAGNVILPFEYALTWDVKGRLVNQTKEGWIWLDLKNDPDVIKITTYDHLDYSYHNNLILAGQNEKVGYLDRKGNVAIPFIFEQGNRVNALGDRFSDGFAAVRRNGKWGFIDTTGQVRIPFLYDDKQSTTYLFTDGIAAVKLNGKWGYINKNGRAITEFLYYGGSQPDFFENGLVKYWAFKEGDAPYSSHNSNFTIIDTTGKPITDLTFTKVGKFEKGFAQVCQGNYCGLIDLNGKLVIPLKYEFVNSNTFFETTRSRETSIFHYGLLLVKDPETKKVLGYINKAGKQFWED